LRLAGLPRGGASQSRSSSLLSESSSSGQPSREQQQTNASNVPTAEIHPFFKDSYGRYIVLYSYHAQDENDLSVERGQCVTVLNKDDPEWFWVVRADAQEGFVPAGFVYPLDAIQQNNRHQPVTGGGVQGGAVNNRCRLSQYPAPPTAPRQRLQAVPESRDLAVSLLATTACLLCLVPTPLKRVTLVQSS